MQPFRVICETCNARLKVSSEAVIGEIHACPKCGSMVHIRRPTESQEQVIAQTSSESIECGPAAATSFETTELFDAIRPAVDTSDAAIESVVPPSPVASGWSPATWWGIAAAGLIATGGLVAAVVFNRNDESSATRQPVAQSNDAADQGQGAAAPEAEKSEEPTTSAPEEQAADATGGVSLAQAADENEVTAESEAVAATPAAPELPPAEVADTSKSDPSVGTPSAEGVAQAADALPKADASAPTESEPKRDAPVMKFDPLDFDPAQFSFNESTPTSEQHAETAVPNNGDAEPPPLDGAAKTPDGQPGNPAPPPPAPTLTMRLGPMPKEDKSSKPAAAQLAVRIDSFSVAEMPLTRFVATVSDIGEVPITLDPIQLQLAGVSSRQPVAVDIKDTSAENVFELVLKKNRLSIVEQDGNLSVALIDADRRREVVYDVADLCGDADASAIAGLIRSLVAPESWEGANAGTIAAEGTKLRINQTQAVRHEVLIFVERLRLARGLPQRSRYPAALLRVRSPYETLAPALAKRTTFTFLPWTEFAEVTDQWQQASKLTLLVDWSALASARLKPSSPIMSSAVDRPWRDVLDESLNEIGLGWWAVDGKTVQITTNEALNELRVVEFHVVPQAVRDQFASNTAFVESMQQELSKLKADASASPSVVTYDEPSGRLLVLGNAEAQRYVTERFSPDARVAAHE